MEIEKRIKEAVIIVLIALIVFIGVRYTSLVIYQPSQELNGSLSLNVNRFVLENSSIELILEDQKVSVNLNDLVTQEITLNENNLSGYNISNLDIDLNKFKLVSPSLEGNYNLYVKIIENELSVYETIELIEVRENKVNANITNNPPIFKEIPNQIWNKNSNKILDLSNYVSDKDNDSLVISNTFVDSIKVNINNYIIEFIPDNDFIGVREIWFIANDSKTVSYSYGISLNVSDIIKLDNFTQPIANETTNLTLTGNITNQSYKIVNAKKDYKLSEDVSLEFEYISEQELLKAGKQIKKQNKPKQINKWQTSNEIVNVKLLDVTGQEVVSYIEIEEIREGKFNFTIPKKRELRVGLYKLKVELITNNYSYTIEQNFTWGVLAINTDKSIYPLNEEAFISIAVLDDFGGTVCDASLTLEIIGPNNTKTVLTTENGIKINPDCIFGATGLPDYYAYYSVNGVGTYLLNLTAVTGNGVKSIQDAFYSEAHPDFDVRRKGPTRIALSSNYTMRFEIKANSNANEIIEYVPSSFEISSQNGLSVIANGDTKQLVWNIGLKKNEAINLSYEFDAPDISPYLFLLGKLQIGNWQEKRYWQIASDLFCNGVQCTAGNACCESGGPSCSTGSNVGAGYSCRNCDTDEEVCLIGICCASSGTASGNVCSTAFYTSGTYSYIYGTANKCCGNTAGEDFASGANGWAFCCDGVSKADDNWCSGWSSDDWQIDGVQCSSVVRDPSVTSGTACPSGDDIVCGCDSSGVICDNVDAGCNAQGICTSNGCNGGLASKTGSTYASSCTGGYECDTDVGTTPGYVQEGTCLTSGTCQTSGAIGLAGGTYSAGCAAGRECDSSVLGGAYSRNGYCASTSCCTSVIRSGEVSGAVWTDGDEACSCGSAGDICDNTPASGPTSVGACASSSCTTGLVATSDQVTYVTTCAAGRECDSAASGGYVRNGYCASTTCATSVIVASTDGSECGTLTSGCASADFTAGDEDFQCDTSNEAAICDNSPSSGPTATGTCVEDSCTTSGVIRVNCGTDGCTSADLTDANMVVNCDATSGDACDGSIDSSGYGQTGTCAASTCDTLGELCYNTSTSNYQTSCSSCANDNACDSDATSGGDFNANGLCCSSSCFINASRTSGQSCCSNANCGSGLVCNSGTCGSPDSAPVVNLNNPINFYNTTPTTIVFNATVWDDINLTNVTLYGNWTGSFIANETNSSGINNTYYIFTKDLSGYSSGSYLWNIFACDNTSACSFNNTNRTFIIDGILPYFTQINTNQSTIRNAQWINFSSVLTDNNGLSGYIFSINQTGNWVNSSFTTTSGTNVTIYNVTNITATEATTVEWRFYANDSSNNWNQTSLQSFLVAGIPPYFTNIQTNQTNIYRNNYINFSAVANDNLGLRYYWFEINMSSAGYINSTPIAISGINTQIWNVTLINVVANTNVSWRFWANDSANTANSTALQSFIVQNSTPTHNNPIFSPSTPVTTNNLTCINQSTNDNDGDVVTNIYDWRFNDSGSNSVSFAVLNMPFDRNVTSTTSGSVTDYSTFSNNGTVNSGINWTSNGKLGGAYTFDGVNDYVDAGSGTFLNGLTQLTISAWIKKTSSTSNAIINRWHPSDTQNQFIFRVDATTNKLRSYVASSTTDGGNNFGVGTQTLSDNVWYHIVYVYNGSASTNPTRLKFYIDGVQDTLSFTGTIPSSLTSPTQNLWIANQQNAVYFNGTIDEVKVYNRTLSVAQIYEDYIRGFRNYYNSTLVSNEFSLNLNLTCCVTPTDNSTDGTTKCVSAVVGSEVVDTTPPYFTLNQTNQSTIRKGQWINFSEVLTDETALSGYIFSINQTGNWLNASFVTTSGTNVTIYNVTNITANRGTTIEWRFYANDSSNNWNQSILHYFTVSNTVPGNTTLLTPSNASTTTDRRPNFTWNAVTDFDTNDNVIYNIYISKFADFSSLDITTYNISITSHVSKTELSIGGGSQKYFWKIETYDNTSFGDNSSSFEFTLNSEVSISLNVSAVNFGTLNPGDSKNTTTSDPESIVVQNDGNTYINVNISALDALWDVVGLGTTYFQYAAGNYTGETPAFNWSGSTTSFTNIPSTNTTFIDYLNYSNATDLVRVHLLIRVPSDEPAGNKSSTLVIGAQLGE